MHSTQPSSSEQPQSGSYAATIQGLWLWKEGGEEGVFCLDQLGTLDTNVSAVTGLSGGSSQYNSGQEKAGIGSG